MSEPDTIYVFAQPLMLDGHDSPHPKWTPARILAHLAEIGAPLRLRFYFWCKWKLYGDHRAFTTSYLPWFVGRPFCVVHYIP
jgi:hypothetical protein